MKIVVEVDVPGLEQEIKEAIKGNHWSNEKTVLAIADVIGRRVSRQTIANACGGKRKMEATTVAWICMTLGIPLQARIMEALKNQNIEEKALRVPLDKGELPKRVVGRSRKST